MTMHLPEKSRSLFRSTASTVAAALLIFQFVLIAATVNYVVLPMAQRSADDLAAIIILSAKTWVELPPETRKDFELELLRQHQLMLFHDVSPLPPRTAFLPYLNLLDNALSARLGKPISVKVTDLETTWFWVEIPAGRKLIRIGFPKSRINTDPPMMLLLALLATIVLTLVTALILARRITRPLAQFSLAAQRIGEGNIPEPLADNGIQELSSLVTTFNRMAVQVREHLANRTTMLAGISHDLRTPLARMRLAIEMLPETVGPRMIERLQRDIDSMNVLIGEFLVLSRDLQKETPEQINLKQMLHALAEDAAVEGIRIDCDAQADLIIPAGPVSLHRVLLNLISNAARYGGGKPVQIESRLSRDAVVIRIMDRGPGIPPHEVGKVFRPFYRVESSRNDSTGGSGLGLAIVRQLTEANGWEIELRARAGGGTEVILRIPLSESQQEQP